MTRQVSSFRYTIIHVNVQIRCIYVFGNWNILIIQNSGKCLGQILTTAKHRHHHARECANLSNYQMFDQCQNSKNSGVAQAEIPWWSHIWLAITKRPNSPFWRLMLQYKNLRHRRTVPVTISHHLSGTSPLSPRTKLQGVHIHVWDNLLRDDLMV